MAESRHQLQQMCVRANIPRVLTPYLIARLGIRTGDLFSRVIRKDGLTLQMYRVLAALTEVDHPLRLGELAALTSADLSTLSRVVAEMHRRAYLQRERREHDQRSLQVTLLKPGRELAARYMPVAAHYEQVAARSLSVEEVQSLRSTLIQLHGNLDQIESQIEDGSIERLIRLDCRSRPHDRASTNHKGPKERKGRLK